MFWDFCKRFSMLRISPKYLIPPERDRSVCCHAKNMAVILKPAVIGATGVWPVERSNVPRCSEFTLHFIVCVFCYHYHYGIWSRAWRAIKSCVDVWPDCGLAICCEIIIAGGLQHVCEGCVPAPENKLFSQMTDFKFERPYATHVLHCGISTCTMSRLAQVAHVQQTLRMVLTDGLLFTLQWDCVLVGQCSPLYWSAGPIALLFVCVICHFLFLNFILFRPVNL